MATFVLMTKLTPEVFRNLKERERVGKEWLAKIKEKCPDVKWLCHYSLLGPYDFMSIYEAPNEEVASKVSLLTLSLGAMQAESWTALPYSRFLDLVKEVLD